MIFGGLGCGRDTITGRQQKEKSKVFFWFGKRKEEKHCGFFLEDEKGENDVLVFLLQRLKGPKSKFFVTSSKSTIFDVRFHCFGLKNFLESAPAISLELALKFWIQLYLTDPLFRQVGQFEKCNSPHPKVRLSREKKSKTKKLFDFIFLHSILIYTDQEKQKNLFFFFSFS